MKKLTAILLALCVALSLCACAGAKSSSQDVAYESAAEEPEPMAQGYAADMATNTENGEYYGLEEEKADTGAGETPDVGEMAASSGRKIIYTYDYYLETREFEQSAADLEKAVKAAGGYIQASSQSGGSFGYNKQYYSARNAYYTLRIPAEKAESFVQAVSAVGTVRSSSVSSDDVTKTYIDTSARLDSLKTQETRLLELLEKADDIETLLAIESKLADVRYEIESYQSQINTYDTLIKYCTFTVNLEEVRESAPVVSDSFGVRFSDAVKDSLIGVGNFLKDFVIFLVYALPYIVILALIWFFVVKRLIKRGGLKREAKRLAAAAAATDASEKSAGAVKKKL